MTLELYPKKGHPQPMSNPAPSLWSISSGIEIYAYVTTCFNLPTQVYVGVNYYVKILQWQIQRGGGQPGSVPFSQQDCEKCFIFI